MALPYETLHIAHEPALSLEPQSAKYLLDNTKALISTAVDVVDNQEAYVLVAGMLGLTEADVKISRLQKPFDSSMVTELKLDEILSRLCHVSLQKLNFTPQSTAGIDIALRVLLEQSQSN